MVAGGGVTPAVGVASIGREGGIWIMECRAFIYGEEDTHTGQ
jgi:hypothetical protein